MWERRAERKRENAVRAIVLPCGKVTKEKCERVHQREDGETGEMDREGRGCRRGCKKVGRR